MRLLDWHALAGGLFSRLGATDSHLDPWRILRPVAVYLFLVFMLRA
jgi:hypothetical protein